MADVIGEIRGAVEPEAGAYRHGEDRPLAGYVLVMAVFSALVAGAAGSPGQPAERCLS